MKKKEEKIFFCITWQSARRFHCEFMAHGGLAIFEFTCEKEKVGRLLRPVVVDKDP